MANSFYKQKHTPQTSFVHSFWMDGVRGDYFEGRLHLTGGWNIGEPPTPLRNTHKVSSDLGVTWSDIPGIPWAARHTHAHGVYGGFLWISGGNDVIDLWKYSIATGWDQVTVTGVSVQLDHFGTVMDGKNIFFFGGWLSGSFTSSNNIYKLDVETGILSLVAPVPAAIAGNANSGCLVKKGSAFIYFGGGNYNVNPAPDINTINTKVFRSDDDCVTWTQIADEPLLNSFLWGDAVATDNEIWAVSGSDLQNSVSANNRMVRTTDGINWSQPAEIFPGGRHASIMFKDDVGNFYGGMGYGQNDFWLINRVV